MSACPSASMPAIGTHAAAFVLDGLDYTYSVSLSGFAALEAVVGVVDSIREGRQVMLSRRTRWV